MRNRNAVTWAVAFWMYGIVAWGPVLAAEKPVIRDAPAPKTMLFIGNSFIYYNGSLHNHMRKLSQSLNPDNAKSYYFKSLTLSAAYLSDHAAFAGHMIESYKNKRKNGPWNLVVLQGHSREPISKKKSSAFQAAARMLDAKIRGADSRTVFFMTWAYKTKPEMTQKLRDAYTRIGNELKALVVPVGVAFARARSEAPDKELYHEDEMHPSLLGTYLTACVFYATLYGKSPVGAHYTAGLSAADAKFAQTVAWDAVGEYFGR